MKVFLFDSKTLSVIDKKEEITDDTCFITDAEYDKIAETMQADGHFWRIDERTVGCSGKAPSTDYVWNDETHEWELSQELVTARLDKERDVMWTKIKLARAKHVASGVEVDGKWYHTDDEARSNYYSLTVKIVLGEQINRMWKTMDGSFVKMTNDLFCKIADALDKEKVTADFANAEKLYAQVKASDKPLEVDITVGWSKGYAK